MKIEDVKARIEKIRQGARLGDSEAHRVEDCLHREVLETIAAGAPDPAALAAAALETRRLHFGRFY